MNTTSTKAQIRVGRKSIHAIQNEHARALDKLGEFYDALQEMHYGGKVSFGRSIKQIEEILRFFKEDLYPHIQLDELIIFPFIEQHIPKLDPMIRLFRCEHKEFKSNLELFEHLFHKLKRVSSDDDRPRTLEELRDRGMYLVCLLRNHILAESESIYRTSGQELKQDELNELTRSIKRFEKTL